MTGPMTSDDTTRRRRVRWRALDPFSRRQLLLGVALFAVLVTGILTGRVVMAWLALVAAMLVLHDETAHAVRRTVLRLPPRRRFERLRYTALLVGFAVALGGVVADETMVAWVGVVGGLLLHTPVPWAAARGLARLVRCALRHRS
ncbi:hypothetical protein [Saccharothrix sp. HUAS TT1]|uniref:hypothetical protein n=1 Tax=unclassified Saccharothrix TaxID=2593673 RepID=UPI00345B5529